MSSGRSLVAGATGCTGGRLVPRRRYRLVPARHAVCEMMASRMVAATEEGVA